MDRKVKKEKKKKEKRGKKNVWIGRPPCKYNGNQINVKESLCVNLQIMLHRFILNTVPLMAILIIHF